MEGKVPKICDFGSSIINCSCYDGPRDQEGSTPWDSPELMEEDTTRTTESDVWAFGCAALEIQMGLMPWDRDGNVHRAMSLQIRGGYPAKEEWLNLGDNGVLQGVWGLMKCCWQEEPSERPKLQEILFQLEELAAVNLVPA
ncbi:Tyrosine kinase domain protein [Ceratobasidium sp. AG-Ba]|nr:Tyrosine kinase domain protein [Ceratobasidium sp. AG-Ba]